MRRLSALLSGLLVSVSLVIVSPVSPAAAAATASTATPAAGPIDWAPCPQFPDVECGTLTVPIDWNDPAAGTFGVGVARRKATDQAARIGVLVLGAGGPGGSGVNLVLGSPHTFSPELLRRFDVVGLDPRGTNRSHPVVCSTELLRQAPDPLLKSQADFDRALAYNERLRADCRARTGPLFDHVDSLSTAADLDAFRAALGEERLTYWGGSYGTLLGQLYAERYPHRVRASTLDSTMDHSLGTRAFMDTETWAAQDAFDEFVAWCARDERCLQHGRDVRAFWRNLLARADRGELGELTASELIGAAVGHFYDPANWLPFSQLLAELDAGRAPSPDALALTTGLPAHPAAQAQGQEQQGQAQEVSRYPFQIFCLDFRLPVRDYREFAGHMRRQARIAPDMRYSPLSLGPVVSCLGQPDPIPNPQHRLKVRTGTPVLVVNALHDPATTYPWALSIARQLGRSGRLLTYEGWGHIGYGRGDCVTAATDAYLLSRTVPARGARCPAVPPAENPPAENRTLRELVTPLPGTPGWGLNR
ncbi:alpha/beta fold hydrolase [Nonomuraea sp. NN258]|uniref:alpha/beta hydrolase n=1 Tax=Nonomuraea antri TaxID=2730852 RepID=UPI00156A3BAF|nr:alpha/beta hydrolase [Nonomuraea antri]NRQ39275.1 alpha/beta fold hydrolase [Nonomuraea antri]